MLSAREEEDIKEQALLQKKMERYATKNCLKGERGPREE
jgi:hypothetical protein